MSAPDDRPLRTYGRRGFLQLGFLGAAGASVLSSCGATAGTVPPTPRDPGGPTPAQLRSATESWNEPWVWRPSEWPGQPLQLNVVESQSTGPVVGMGNPDGRLFSYGGQTPGPTIRMRGDETLRVQLRNLLGFDGGQTAIGPNPDPNELTPALDARVAAYQTAHPGTPLADAITAVIGNDVREDYCLGEHTNGIHSAHVTNLHTHGLHVRPYRNPDGTHSDNVILRLLPQADFRRRERAARAAECEFLRAPTQTDVLRADEQVGKADYEFRIGNVQAQEMAAEGRPPQPHPPGTHWYHPHSHGATHNQVASGMAGFLVVEGDVDEAINRRLTGDPHADPALKTGDWDYRERLMLVQRVFRPTEDPDSPQQIQKSTQIPSVLVNGNLHPPVITMRPGAVERWRMLNGSVDGRGYKRMMALDGLYGLDADKRLARYDAASEAYVRAPYRAIEADKLDLALLALDGVTLVGLDGAYQMRDLSRQNAGSANPLWGDMSTPRAALDTYRSVFRDGESIRNTWVRPNEVYFGPANRADVVFQAPRDAAEGTIYTVVAKSVIVHSDQTQLLLQNWNCTLDPPDSAHCTPGKKPAGPQDIIVAYIVVKNEIGDQGPAPAGAVRTGPCPPFEVMSLQDDLPPAPPYLQPVAVDELRAPDGRFRTRQVAYSGWGSADYPLVTTDPSDPSGEAFRAFVADHPDLRGLVYDAVEVTPDGGPIREVEVLMPPAIRTMAIDGRKFDPTDPLRPRMLTGTAEEWALHNHATMLWGDVRTGRAPGQYKGHFRCLPLSRAEGQARYDREPTFGITTKAVDHPFHMHQNPFWVTRIEIPDEHGDLHNILTQPQWMDAVWIPRHRGRVVFRSRFPDFVGTYVHHCHILQHEDNGMMTVVEITPFADQANDVRAARVADGAMTGAEVDALYPRPSQAEAYALNASFVDPNHATGQVYPGFAVTAPTG